MLGSCLIAIEAKDALLHFPYIKEYEKAIVQTLGYAAALLRTREDEHRDSGIPRKITPIFAAVTSGLCWQFFGLDIDGSVYSSGNLIYIDRPVQGGYSQSVGLPKVISWLVWMLNTMRSISPRCSVTELNETDQNLNIQGVQKSFIR